MEAFPSLLSFLLSFFLSLSLSLSIYIYICENIYVYIYIYTYLSRFLSLSFSLSLSLSLSLSFAAPFCFGCRNGAVDVLFFERRPQLQHRLSTCPHGSHFHGLSCCSPSVHQHQAPNSNTHTHTHTLSLSLSPVVAAPDALHCGHPSRCLLCVFPTHGISPR